MALDKKRTLGSGVDVEHWVISGIQIDYLNVVSKIVLAGYLSKAAKDDKKATVIRREYTCPGILGMTTDPRTEGYVFLKSLPEFAGAKGS